MSAPFAALESRVTAAIIAHLANVTATIADPVELVDRDENGVFDAAYVAPFELVATPSPHLLLQESQARNVVYRTPITIGGVGYQAVKLMPDGRGMVAIKLERQP